MQVLLAALASLIFVAITALEVQHDIVQRGAWPGYTPAFSNVVYVLAPLWLLSAVAVWIRRAPARFVLLLGGFLALTHGVGVRIGGSHVGVLFVVAGPLALLLAWYATPGRVLGRVPDDERERAARPARQAVLAGSMNGHPIVGRDPGGIRIVRDPRRR